MIHDYTDYPEEVPAVLSSEDCDTASLLDSIDAIVAAMENDDE